MTRVVRSWMVGAAVFLFIGIIVASQLVSPTASMRDLVQQPYAWTALVAMATGSLLALRRQEHPIGWLLLAFGSTTPLVLVGVAIAERLAAEGDLEAAGWAESIGYAPAGTMLIIPLIILVFPDGRLLDQRWRSVLWLMVGVTIVGAAAGLLNGGWGGDLDQVVVAESPLRDRYGGLGDALSTIFYAGVGACVFAAVASFVLRFRISRGDARQQLKWMMLAGSYLSAVLIVALLTGAQGTFEAILIASGLGAIPLAIAIAILRYRLYDIDVVINKAMVFGALGLLIAAVYVAVVVGVGSLLGSGDGSEFVLGVVATALVAIAFHPVRTRVQRWANRVVYGERATPYEVLARFSRRAAEADDSELLSRIPRLIVDGTGAAKATLWTRVGDRFIATASWPFNGSASDLALDLPRPWHDPEADYSLPVTHGGDLLGGISLVKGRGESVTPSEEALLRDLVSGMGLALRNSRLTARLQEQVEELEASRERILAADDEARRTLEHDLDSGPQQQLVAMKVMLGPVRKQAEAVGAVKTAEVLSQLESDAGSAIKAIRDFSGGVYPPLLEAEGLAVAIRQQARSSATPVRVEADAVGRLPREVESAVYFTVLEALQNVAKYGDAGEVVVRLSEREGVLEFSISDDGIGFDPTAATAGSGLANMADRIDAVGGVWALESAPGQGTTVRGSVPSGSVGADR